MKLFIVLAVFALTLSSLGNAFYAHKVNASNAIYFD